SSTQFALAPGLYYVAFQVSVTEPGQLEIQLGPFNLTSTVVGRAAPTSQIVGFQLVRNFANGTLLSVRNPAVNATALTITPNAGGTSSVSAHLTILQIA